MAGQSPHIIHRQAGRLVGLPCQRGQPVQSHKGEEASVINRVLVPEIDQRCGEREKRSSEMSKSPHRGTTVGQSGPTPADVNRAAPLLCRLGDR